MNYINTLKEKLEKNEKIYSTMLCHVGFTLLPRIYKAGGLDMMVMDLEHGSFYPENIGDFCMACHAQELPVIVRVQDCEYHCISKPIDMGADGVLIPRTETIEQVETAINSLRFYPYGKKGVGGRALLRYDGEFSDIYKMNENRLLFIQIESKQGTDLLDEILTKYGDQIAGVIIGPNDMGVSMGVGLDMQHPDLLANIERTVAICNAHKKSIGIFMANDNEAEYWSTRGMNIYWLGTELGMLGAEVRRNKARIDSF